MKLYTKGSIRGVAACLAVAGLLMLPACGAGNDGESAARKTIRLSHGHAADFSSEIHTAAWIFQQWVNDHSDTLEVRIYPSSQLGEEREVYEGMQMGAGASCVISGTAILSNFEPAVGVLDLPFLWEDYDHVHRVLDGEVGDELEDRLRENGLEVLAWMDSWGYRNVVTADIAVTRPEQLEGLKIRTIQSPTYIAAVKAMGANPTPMAFGEVYTSLQTGVIDGFEHSAAVVLASKFYEVADHMTMTRHLFGPLVFCYSKQEWDALDETERAVLREGARMARDVQRSLAPLREQQALDALAEEGMETHSIDTTVIRERAQSLQESLASEAGATDLLERIRAAAGAG